MTAPPLARATSNGRVYRHPLTGEEVPSVTAIIDGGVPIHALKFWAAKAAAEYADRQWNVLGDLSSEERIALIKGAPFRESEKKKNMGSFVHEAIDAWCTDRRMPKWEPGVEPFMEQFAAFLQAREPKFVANEATVWNRTYGYAGTLDFLADINGRMTLCDAKTGKDAYPSVAMQLVALAKAEFIIRPDGTEEPMPAVDLLAVLHVRPRSWALIPVTPGVASWEAFLAAKRITEWSRDTAPTVLGARLKEPV